METTWVSRGVLRRRFGGHAETDLLWVDGLQLCLRSRLCARVFDSARKLGVGTSKVDSVGSLSKVRGHI